MSYAKKILLENENIVKVAKIHWFIYVTSLIFLAVFFLPVPREDKAAQSAFVIMGLLFLLQAFITRKSTEFFVTNKRVIAKKGFISRDTIEINLNKVESLGVKQGVFGRIFNFGTVIVNGTGSTSAPFKFIADPLGLRRAVNEQIANKE